MDENDLFGEPFYRDPGVSEGGGEIIFKGDWNGFWARFADDLEKYANEDPPDGTYFRGLWRKGD